MNDLATRLADIKSRVDTMPTGDYITANVGDEDWIVTKRADGGIDQWILDVTYVDPHIEAFVLQAAADIRYVLDRLRTLEAALQPFVAMSDAIGDWLDSSIQITPEMVTGDVKGRLVVGDVRRAAAVLRGDDEQR